MSKSILVIDTPKCCKECPLDVNGMNGENVCRGREKYRYNPDSSKKPDWCPLRDLPEKKVMDFREECSMYISRYWEGYNACIDEILKECD